MTAEKTRLRRQFLAARRARSASDWRDRSNRLCAHLQASEHFQTARVVLSYFSYLGEPDLSPLLADRRRHWAFPRCVGASLAWHYWQPGEPLVANAVGISEPSACAPLCIPSQADLLIVPALACDTRGYRLGYGGGFYDRLLAQPAWQSKVAIAAIFTDAIVPELPVDAWDRLLSGICTEDGLSLRPFGQQEPS
ncbi:5,10-methenyltetrahydrofolate synthetase [Rubidibacter lacunae KORDI 51-2]|uniref:5-formyltetrahydrofolate cyclo-ligase n=1 Tax=Rubidibacter lacunae KORDI 51-2 TaxID=582515 RepID=U5DM64_9CHRO|nr:5-formyltetrahydrofolate cyclo-ligase [Rubidibacter lacunae]ERN41972.1 5,10-methenyltetrahydrofolate synthetase [Rubidibacter lacunae KORDI 51-2]